jgi:hypothetical protein
MRLILGKKNPQHKMLWANPLLAGGELNQRRNYSRAQQPNRRSLQLLTSAFRRLHLQHRMSPHIESKRRMQNAEQDCTRARSGRAEIVTSIKMVRCNVDQNRASVNYKGTAA